MEIAMPRPKAPHPTPAELEVLKILWDQSPLSVREVWDVLRSQQLERAYTSVLSLLNVMTDKGLLVREPQGRAFLYRPGVSREKTLGDLLGDLWQRAFSGSTSTLVAHLLEQTQPSEAELRAIRDTLQRFEPSEEPSP
jgi:BlaI family transcriptional regulator, penicillinase repressor